MALKGAVAVRGIFEASGDRITLHDTSGSKACKSSQGDGVYQWSFDGTQFKLLGLTDKCGTRVSTLSGSIWTIEP